MINVKIGINSQMNGNRELVADPTLREDRIDWDLNGFAARPRDEEISEHSK